MLGITFADLLISWRTCNLFQARQTGDRGSENGDQRSRIRHGFLRYQACGHSSSKGGFRKASATVHERAHGLEAYAIVKQLCLSSDSSSEGSQVERLLHLSARFVLHDLLASFFPLVGRTGAGWSIEDSGARLALFGLSGKEKHHPWDLPSAAGKATFEARRDSYFDHVSSWISEMLNQAAQISIMEANEHSNLGIGRGSSNFSLPSNTAPSSALAGVNPEGILRWARARLSENSEECIRAAWLQPTCPCCRGRLRKQCSNPLIPTVSLVLSGEDAPNRPIASPPCEPTL